MFQEWHKMFGEQIAKSHEQNHVQKKELQETRKQQKAKEREIKDKMIAELTHEAILCRVCLILLALKAKSVEPIISNLQIPKITSTRLANTKFINR